MTPEDPIHFDSVHIIPEDWDEIADGEIDLDGIKLADRDDSAERV